MATVTAGLMWAPLIWLKHCTSVAMDNPKQRAMRTRSGGGVLSFVVAAQLTVDPRLSSTKINMAKNSPDTARQKAFVHTPLKAAITRSHVQGHEGTHLLRGERQGKKFFGYFMLKGIHCSWLSYSSSLLKICCLQQNRFKIKLNLCILILALGMDKKTYLLYWQLQPVTRNVVFFISCAHRFINKMMPINDNWDTPLFSNELYPIQLSSAWKVQQFYIFYNILQFLCAYNPYAHTTATRATLFT